MYTSKWEPNWESRVLPTSSGSENFSFHLGTLWRADVRVLGEIPHVHVMQYITCGCAPHSHLKPIIECFFLQAAPPYVSVCVLLSVQIHIRDREVQWSGRTVGNSGKVVFIGITCLLLVIHKQTHTHIPTYTACSLFSLHTV